jgi:hypothetical protein
MITRYNNTLNAINVDLKGYSMNGLHVYRSEKVLGTDSADSDNVRGIDHSQLFFEPFPAGSNLVCLGVPVARTVTLAGIGDVDVFTGINHNVGQQPVQLSAYTCPVNEGLAYFVLLLTGTFTDKHDTSWYRAVAANYLGPGLAKSALGTFG